MTTINSIIDMLVKGGLNEAMAFEFAEAEDVNAEASGYTWMADEAEAIDNGVLWDDEDDYMDDWEIKEMERRMYAEEIASREYLEDVIARLDDKQDVRVDLSSATAYFTSNDSAPIYMSDCLGNHHAKNWLEAFKTVGCERSFKVISKEMQEYGTLVIWIDAKDGDKFTAELKETVMDIARREAFRF